MQRGLVMDNRNFLNDLPDELLDEIERHLSSDAVASNLARTCHRFFNLINPTTLDVSRQLELESLQSATNDSNLALAWHIVSGDPEFIFTVCEAQNTGQITHQRTPLQNAIYCIDALMLELFYSALCKKKPELQPRFIEIIQMEKEFFSLERVNVAYQNFLNAKQLNDHEKIQKYADEFDQEIRNLPFYFRTLVFRNLQVQYIQLNMNPDWRILENEHFLLNDAYQKFTNKFNQVCQIIIQSHNEAQNKRKADEDNNPGPTKKSRQK